MKTALRKVAYPEPIMPFNNGQKQGSERGTQRSRMGEIIDRTKGKIKQAVGALTGDKRLKREGERDELKGRVKGVAKDVKRAVKDAVT
jgi:uncharacterized protein YjbJ (UPF0337 family)